jgi:hypothetical protein
MVAFLLLLITLLLIIGVRLASSGAGKARGSARKAATGVKSDRTAAAARMEGKQV